MLYNGNSRQVVGVDLEVGSRGCVAPIKQECGVRKTTTNQREDGWPTNLLFVADKVNNAEGTSECLMLVLLCAKRPGLSNLRPCTQVDSSLRRQKVRKRFFMASLPHQQNTPPDDEDKVPGDPRPTVQLWLFRWLVFGFLAAGFLVSIAAIILTQNPLLASIPAAILLTMRPIVRWLYR